MPGTWRQYGCSPPTFPGRAPPVCSRHNLATRPGRQHQAVEPCCGADVQAGEKRGSDNGTRTREGASMSPDKSSFSSSSFLKRWKKLIELGQMAGLSIGLWTWEMPTDGLVWSDETYRQLGYTRDTFSGRGEDFFRRLHPEDRQRVEEAVQRVLAGSSEYNVKFRVVRPDGSTCWIHSCGVLVHPGASRMVGICIDITGLEDMEAQLQRNEERMRLAFDAANLGFWDRNLVTGETVWSATASRQLGLPDGFPMSFAIFMNAVHPDR